MTSFLVNLNDVRRGEFSMSAEGRSSRQAATEGWITFASARAFYQQNFPMGHVPSIKNETIAFFVGFLPEGAGRERLLSNLGRRKPTPS